MKNNNHEEPEEKKQTHAQQAQPEIIPDADMLTEEVPIDRSGASQNPTGQETPGWTPPQFVEGSDEEPEEPKKPDPADHPLANPGLKDAPPHVKHQGAMAISQMVIQLYSNIKKWTAESLVLISQRKLDKLEETGEIDTEVLLPLRGGGAAPAISLINEHNGECVKAIEKHEEDSKEFYEQATPMLAEELAKRNIAPTNIEMLLGLTGINLFQFGMTIKPLIADRRGLIHAFKEATAAYKAAPPGYQPHYAQQPAPPPPGPQQSEPPPAPFEQRQPAYEQPVEEIIIPEENIPMDMHSSDPAADFDNIQGNRGSGAVYHEPIPQHPIPVPTMPRKKTYKSQNRKGKPRGKYNKNKVNKQ